MFLASRNLFQDKTRLALSVAEVALAILLTLILTGFRDGLYRRLTAYLDRAPGSVIVAQAGANNFLAATSLLPPGTIEAARQVPGVAAVTPLLSMSNTLAIGDERYVAHLFGLPADAAMGGSWRIVTGRSRPGLAEAIIDRSVAEQAQVRVGVVLGLLAGLGLIQLLTAGVPRFAPSLSLQVSGASPIKVGLAALVLVGGAALVPIRQIAGLDPAMVFKGGGSK